jgi:hypothetical protein
MHLIPCTDQTFGQEVAGESFTVQVNPEKYSTNQEVRVAQQQAPGTSGAEVQYLMTPPQRMEFEFLFDGTGAVPEPSSGGLLDTLKAGFQLLGTETKSTVMERLEKFRHTVLTFQGDQHQPRFVKLVWGTLLFKGRLVSMNTRYTLFQPDGTPLRAVVTCTFVESIADSLRTRKEAAQSPDLTHRRVVQEGDTLSLLTYRQYGDPGLCLEVARVNGLDSLRRLRIGQTLTFPPVEK